MIGENDVHPRRIEGLEVLGVTVAFDEQDVIGIHFADGFDKPVKEWRDHLPCRIRRFVDQIIAGNPGLIAIVGRDCLPQHDRPILKVLVFPQECLVRGVVAVPMLILMARESVKIDDRVQPVFRA
jgi:hypothetical protein